MKKLETEKMRKQGNRDINPGENPESDISSDDEGLESSSDEEEEVNGEPTLDNDSLAAVCGSKDSTLNNTMEEGKEENLLGFSGSKDDEK